MKARDVRPQAFYGRFHTCVPKIAVLPFYYYVVSNETVQVVPLDMKFGRTSLTTITSIKAVKASVKCRFLESLTTRSKSREAHS